MKILIALALCAAPLIARAEEPKTWKLLETRQDGLIADIKRGLTKKECEFARNRILGLPATDEEKASAKAEQEKNLIEAKKFLDQNPQCHWLFSYMYPDLPHNAKFYTYDSVCYESDSGKLTTTMNWQITKAECFQ